MLNVTNKSLMLSAVMLYVSILSVIVLCVITLNWQIDIVKQNLDENSWNRREKVIVETPRLSLLIQLGSIL
jgi:hypothetical protein